MSLSCALRAREAVSQIPEAPGPESAEDAAMRLDPLLPGQQLMNADPIAAKDHSLPPPPLPHSSALPLKLQKPPSAEERERAPHVDTPTIRFGAPTTWLANDRMLPVVT